MNTKHENWERKLQLSWSNFFTTKLHSNHLKKATVIEFFGMPGSGKTHITKLLCCSLEEKGYLVSCLPVSTAQKSRWLRVFLKSRLILMQVSSNPASIASIWKLINLYEIHSISKKLKLLFNLSFIVSMSIKQLQNHDVVVFDQGIMQALWSNSYHSNSSPRPEVLIPQLTSLLAQISASQHIVVQLSTLKDRLKKRLIAREFKGTSPIDGTDDSKLAKGLLIKNECERVLTELCKKNTQVITFQFKN